MLNQTHSTFQPIVQSSPGDLRPSLSFLTSAIIFVIFYFLLYHSRQHASVFPPSPPSDPIIGHARVMPTDYQWKTFAVWGKTLGDVIYLSIIGRPIIVLNSAEAARDLMDKRSANYSDRPRIVIIGEMLGWGNMLSFLRYGERFRKQRRIMHRAFNSQAVVSFRELQTKHIKAFLLGLLDQPDNRKNLTNRLMGATILKATYGHDVISTEDRYTAVAVEAASCAVASGVPGAPLVDLFPFLRHIPKWFPGAKFKRNAEIGRRLTEEMINMPYEDVKRQRKAGVVVPSLLNSLLDEYEAQGIVDHEHELNIKNATGIIYAAGVETTEIVATTFFLMMALHPEVVKRAQAEIDSVIGSQRLPNLEDRDRLPYIDCIVKELLRINPPAPLCVPHQSIEEDIYRGKRIPSGSLIIPNIWYMMRDPRFFPDAESFKPERFLEKVRATPSATDSLNAFSLDDPSSIIFGFGRRICPGRHFADASAWLLVSNILAVFSILPQVDPVTGEDIIPEVKYTSGFASHPLPFDCRIIPRSPAHAKVVRDENL